MTRTIDADLAQQIADKELNINEAGIVQYILSHTPTIEMEPVKHGKWIADRYCSNCEYDRKERLFDQYPNYCPNCGADMRGESK